MTTLEHFVSPALTRALGWTLLHSLWQGALVAAVLAGALLLLRRQRAEVRYAASAGALGVMVAVAGITFGLYFNAQTGQEGGAKPSPATTERSVHWKLKSVPDAAIDPMSKRAPTLKTVMATAQPSALGATAAPATNYSFTHSLRHFLKESQRYFDQQLPLLVVAWLLGLLVMGLRLLGGLLYVQRLRRFRVQPLSAAWQERLAGLAARGGVRRPVALLESALVAVPLVVGHLRPAILLPLGAVAGLSPACLEAILAHELAHVLRRDYLVNLLQTVAEALFFYHPAVWFVARCVRTERENCCDDTATVLVGGDPLRLARALAALAEWSHSAAMVPAPRLALAAMGGRGALLNRVRRLVQHRPAAPTLAEGLLAGVLVLGGLGLLGSSVVLAGPLAPTSETKLSHPWRSNSLAHQPTQALDTTKRATKAPAVAGGSTETAPAPPAAPAPPETMPNDSDERGRVVVTRDKKGRLTSLVVDGEPVPAATTELSKAERRAGRQVTVVPLPPAPSEPGAGDDYSSEWDGDMEAKMDNRTRDLDRKMSRKMEKEAQKLEQSGGFHLHVSGDRRRAGRGDGLHIDIDDAALNRLANNALALGNVGLNIGLDAAAQGLEEARQSMKQTLRNPRISPKTRRATERAMQDLDRKQNQGDLEQEKRDREQEVLDREQEKRDREQEKRDREHELQERIRESQQELRDREHELQERIRETQQELRDLERDRADGRRENDEALMAELVKDGLVKDKNHYQVRLTARSLTVDGKTQPNAVFQKYLKLHESATGRKLSATGAMVMTRTSDSSTVSDYGPTPPRPPRAPRPPRTVRAPLAPLAPPAMLAPPAPPLPPRLDTQAVRDELRKDGLVRATDQGFQLQLSNKGLTVNGKSQPEALAAKYRKLLGHDDGKNFNVSISTQE